MGSLDQYKYRDIHPRAPSDYCWDQRPQQFVSLSLTRRGQRQRQSQLADFVSED